MTFRVAAFALIFFFSLPASAATVRVVDDEVSISRGDGYQRVLGSSDAGIGDLVMAGPTGHGTIVYDDGCTVDVKPGEVATVEVTSPCEAGLVPTQGALRGAAPYIIGAGAIGGIAALIALSDSDSDGGNGGGGASNDDGPSGDNDDEPVSP